jgi:hypothetical protein
LIEGTERLQFTTWVRVCAIYTVVRFPLGTVTMPSGVHPFSLIHWFAIRLVGRYPVSPRKLTKEIKPCYLR